MHFFCFFCIHAVVCRMQVLLSRRSYHIYPYWWNDRGTLSWGLLLPRGICSTNPLWSRDIHGCYTCYPVWALHGRLVLHVWLSVSVSCRFVVCCFVLKATSIYQAKMLISKITNAVVFVWWPAGFYCSEGTGFDLRSCPEGTYGPDSGYWSVSQCRQCDGGHYCSARNGTAVSGPCQKGYYCSHGNISPQPASQAAGKLGTSLHTKSHTMQERTVHSVNSTSSLYKKWIINVN